MREIIILSNFMSVVFIIININCYKKKKIFYAVDDIKGLLETYGQVVDFTNKESIKPLVDFVVGGKL